MPNNFDCQNMPEDIKALFFDSYRQPNNTTVTVYVADEREPIKNWLINQGADEEADVVISYHWDSEETVEKFIFEGETDDDDDDEDDVPVVKVKKTKKSRTEETNDDFEITLDIPKVDILEFEDENE